MEKGNEEQEKNNKQEETKNEQNGGEVNNKKFIILISIIINLYSNIFLIGNFFRKCRFFQVTSQNTIVNIISQ